MRSTIFLVLTNFLIILSFSISNFIRETLNINQFYFVFELCSILISTFFVFNLIFNKDTIEKDIIKMHLILKVISVILWIFYLLFFTLIYLDKTKFKEKCEWKTYKECMILTKDK